MDIRFIKKIKAILREQLLAIRTLFITGFVVLFHPEGSSCIPTLQNSLAIESWTPPGRSDLFRLLPKRNFFGVYIYIMQWERTFPLSSFPESIVESNLICNGWGTWCGPSATGENGQNHKLLSTSAIWN